MAILTAQSTSTAAATTLTQPAGTSGWGKFVLLLWKNFLLHWRSKVSSLVEIFIPPLFMLLMVGLRSLTEIEHVPHVSVYQPLDITNFTAIRRNLVIPFQDTLAYSPNGPALRTLMEPVGEWMNLELQPLPNGSALQDFLLGTNSFAGVEFDIRLNGSSTLPQRLNYRLRFPGEQRSQFTVGHSWQTDRRWGSRPDGGARFAEESDGGPSPGYFREGFLTLQHFIFKSFAQQFKTIPDPIPDVYLQRFPYPPFREDSFPSSLTTFLPISVMLAFIYPCISIVKNILFEKEKQIKEAMKIMGLQNWVLWTSWFVKCFVFTQISIGLVVLFLKVPWYSTPNVSVLTYSDAGVIWLIFFVYGISIITFSFMLSTLFSKANSGGAVAAIIWFLAFAPYIIMVQDYRNLTVSQKLGSALLLNSAIGFAMRLVGVYEGTTQGVQWSTLFHDSDVDDINIGQMLLMLLGNAAIYMLITLYIEQVFPGDFGLAQPWYFFVTKRFWCGERPSSDEPVSQSVSSKMNDNIEAEPKGRIPRIQIRELRKVYSNKKIAVEGLSFNMFEGQITALLGHNGAGKTTTMSMLTAPARPFIWGHDIRTEMKSVRLSLGYCPQHNILFDGLTVREHLYFYGRLKGLSKLQAQYEIDKYIKALELVDKADVRSSSLSGGMKRKLCVGIALCAGSRVVLCDEPTSGMDPAARRALWDLLIAEKTRRTMILSTHFMDEADMLGDRIAIMADGKLKAVGSSFFLKKKYGVGYRLICVKQPDCDVDRVTEVLRKHIPLIQVESNVGSELSYLLQEEHSRGFQTMLEELEKRGEELCICDFGISLTTLEEVFMKVGSDSTGVSQVGEEASLHSLHSYSTGTDLESRTTVDDYELLEGWRLFVYQIWALFLKKIYQTYRNWFLLVVQVLIPVLFVAVTIAVVRNWGGSGDMPPRALGLRFYNPSLTLIQREPDDQADPLQQQILDNYMKLFRSMPSIPLRIVDWMEDVFLHFADLNLMMVNRQFIVGAGILNHNLTAWFNNEALHSPPVALQMMHNALLTTFTGERGYNISITNFPLPYTDETRLQLMRTFNNLGFQLAYYTGFAMSFVVGFYVIFYIRERVTKAKLLQLVSGVNRLTYWFTGFIWDYLTYAFVCIFIIVTVAIFQEPGFSTGGEVFRLYSVFLFVGVPALPLTYIVTLYYNVAPAAFIRISVAYIVTGTALFIFVYLLGTDMFELEELSDVLSNVFLIFPHFALCDAIVNLSHMSVTIDACDAVRPPGVTPLPICEDGLYYYQWERPGIGRHLFYCLVMTVAYFAILLLLDFKVLKLLVQKGREWYHRKHFKADTGDGTREMDSDVAREKERIAAMTVEERARTNLVAHEMTKYYNRFLAVNQLSVGINSSECFGLLGANGAGKTTTFKMLSGDETISFGDAWIKGHSLKSELKKVHQHIGYCPQFDALIEDLTGRETLKLFSLLRGVARLNIPTVSMYLAREFGFEKHLDKQVKAYSGGNKRKLSTALAMLGNPSVVYLDEPTSGMDPGAKRNLWNGVCRVRDSGKTIVLTSHSMEECEALCTRLAIMVNGEFKCIGSTQHLKNKEEYQDLLTYYIRSNSMKWSQIFGVMEQAKQQLNIEDYSIGQTSLEQVFLAFTKYQRE
uniref:ABC transporter domain-containing protein n=1 Tax=Anopheles coluzzii TaxID=1518534 RepID=A0A8W7Q2W6_ANOCL